MSGTALALVPVSRKIKSEVMCSQGKDRARPRIRPSAAESVDLVRRTPGFSSLITTCKFSTAALTYPTTYTLCHVIYCLEKRSPICAPVRSPICSHPRAVARPRSLHSLGIRCSITLTYQVAHTGGFSMGRLCRLPGRPCLVMLHSLFDSRLSLLKEPPECDSMTRTGFIREILGSLYLDLVVR